jgi:hypothetical protein
MLKWFSEGSMLLAIAIVFATLVGAWMFRYEPIAGAGRTNVFIDRRSPY